jgi:type VI protein secretion system component VasA
MYWVYRSVFSNWDKNILDLLEKRLITLVQSELDMQKLYEKKGDEKTDEGLESVRVEDLQTIKHLYEADEAL